MHIMHNHRTTILAFGIALAAVLTGCQTSTVWQDEFALGDGRDPSPKTLHMMSRLLIDQGKAEQAEFVLETIIAEDPAYTPAYVELAEMQHRQGRSQDALGSLQRAHLAAPADPVVANNLGVLLLEAGRTDEASQAFNKAVESDPFEARYRGNLALTHALSSDIAAATTGYSSILNPADVHWNVAVALEAVGEPALAADAYDRVHALDHRLDAAEQAKRLRQQLTIVPTP
jgi:Flp pilus assembly protein TadD